MSERAELERRVREVVEHILKCESCEGAKQFALAIVSALGYRTVELEKELAEGKPFPSQQIINEVIGQIEEGKAALAASATAIPTAPMSERIAIIAKMEAWEEAESLAVEWGHDLDMLRTQFTKAYSNLRGKLAAAPAARGSAPK